MDSLEARIIARTAGIDRLARMTAWIGVGAVAAVGVLAVIAAATIPGKASSPQGASSSTNVSTSTSPTLTHHHYEDFGNGTISASSGPPVVVTGGSR